MSNAPIGADFLPGCPWQEKPTKKVFIPFYLYAQVKNIPRQFEIYIEEDCEPNVAALDWCKSSGWPFVNLDTEQYLNDICCILDEYYE